MNLSIIGLHKNTFLNPIRLCTKTKRKP